MSDSEDERLIIIKKRGGDGEEDHHGGVWKLAFADFMTAMMAFFLVMWLINSTTKETKAAIVQYFNPVQIIAGSPAQKGLRDPKPTGQGKSVQHSPEDKSDASASSESVEKSLRAEPIKTLDAIAARDAPTPPKSDAPDVFARLEENSEQTSDGELGAKREKDGGKPRAAELREAIERALAREVRAGHGAPRIEVGETEEGLLISLTDDTKFSMFAVGSSEPKPELVRIVAEIGKTLSTRAGDIELRGHTDARAYAARGYDNWRLSSERAAVARHMLLRGGLAESRVTRLVGYADRKLKKSADPLSPLNRRIEILLKAKS